MYGILFTYIYHKLQKINAIVGKYTVRPGIDSKSPRILKFSGIQSGEMIYPVIWGDSGVPNSSSFTSGKYMKIIPGDPKNAAPTSHGTGELVSA